MFKDLIVKVVKSHENMVKLWNIWVKDYKKFG